MVSTPCDASWGCSPTVAHTVPGWARATSMAFCDWSASVPTQMTRPTPASRARARASPVMPSYWRWQWLSAHMVGQP
jgi:hypothetical protein